MFRRIGYTWHLMGASLDVLKRDKELMLFPLISGIACLLVMASFVAPIFLRPGFMDFPDQNATLEQQVFFYLYLFAFYFCNYFVIVFFNTSIIACAVLRFEGHDPTVGDGLRASFGRLPQIAGWAALSATVGLVLRIIENYSEKVGQVVAGLLGLAWTIVSFLAVPVLVIEKKGPFAALAESTKLLKKTWGEQLVGAWSFGGIFFLLGIPAWLALIGGIALLASDHATLGIALIALAVIYLIVLSLVQSCLQTIFQTALYLYTRDGRAPEGFSAEMLGGALARS